MHVLRVSLSLTARVAAEALALPASVIVSYHPTIFKPVSSLTLANPLQASLLRCAAGGVSVFCPHTSLDCAQGGIADWLASGLDPISVRAIAEKEPGGAGSGRLAHLTDGVNLPTLVSKIKHHLNLKYGLSLVSPHLF